MKRNWFLTSISYDKMAEEGRIMKVSESYIVDAVNFTEAEARITEEMTPYIQGDFKVAKALRARISEIFYNEDGNRWFKGKINFIMFDEEKGVEKKIGATMMVQANDLQEALDGINKGMEGSQADYEIYSITNTEIMQVIKYDEEKPAELGTDQDYDDEGEE